MLGVLIFLEVTGKRGKRRKQLLDEFMERKGYYNLENEAVYCS
jgi:hypothetical protein